MVLLPKPAQKPGAGEKKTGVVTCNGKKYAVGLSWLSAPNDVDTALARRRARQIGADYYALRSTVVNQHGFGFLHMGHRIGMPAAAGILADALVGEWHGIFPLEQGWWYVACHADAIAPEGDRLFFSEEEAYNFFNEQNRGFAWPKSFAPASWNVSDTLDSIDVAKVLNDTTYAPLLSPNTLNAVFGGAKQKGVAMFFGLIALSVILVLGVLPGTVSKSNRKMEKYSLIYDAPNVIKPPPPILKQEKTAPVNYLNRRVPRPSGIIRLCTEGFDKIILPLPGWELDGSRCVVRNLRLASAEVSWSKRIGSLEMVKAYLERFPLEIEVNYNGSDRIVASLDIEGVGSVTHPLRVINREDLISALYERFSDMGRLEIVDRIPPAPKPKKTRGVSGFLVEEKPAPRKPPYLQITLVTQTPPNVLATYFDVPGLNLQNISWSNSGKIWTYEAEALFDSKILSGGTGNE